MCERHFDQKLCSRVTLRFISITQRKSNFLDASAGSKKSNGRTLQLLKVSEPILQEFMRFGDVIMLYCVVEWWLFFKTAFLAETPAVAELEDRIRMQPSATASIPPSNADMELQTVQSMDWLFKKERFYLLVQFWQQVSQCVNCFRKVKRAKHHNKHFICFQCSSSNYDF